LLAKNCNFLILIFTKERGDENNRQYKGKGIETIYKFLQQVSLNTKIKKHFNEK